MIVAKETELSFPQRDGSTKRSHLLFLAKQAGKDMSKELHVDEIPQGALYIMGIWEQLSLTREWLNGQPRRISQADTYYWCKLNDVKLSRIHLNVLQKLDITQINSFNDCIKEHN